MGLFLMLLILSGAAVNAAWVLSHGLTPERRHADLRRWFLPWSLRGLLAPAALWSLMNLGISRYLQPFMPQVQAAQNAGGPWFPAYLRVLGMGLFVISSYWTAITLAWTLTEASRQVDDEARAKFRGLCLVCLIGLAVPAGLMVVLGGWPLFGLAGIALLGPLAHYAPNYLHVQKVPPMYARAVARMKFGKYSEAEWEIIRELEKCEDDFDGWMMLAELYANHFNDLSEAERSILELCNHPKTTPSQVSVALHRLAEWQLQRIGDPAVARGTLQMICRRFPNSHLAHMAQLRINQLPVSAADLREQQSGAPIPMPALSDALDEPPAEPPTEEERKQAAGEANACVEILKADPNNVHAREKLARLFAERLDQAGLGIEQVTLLLDLPDQPEIRRAEWLGLIAAWHIRYRHDAAAARPILERIISEFPKAPQALFARRRLQLLKNTK